MRVKATCRKTEARHNDGIMGLPCQQWTSSLQNTCSVGNRNTALFKLLLSIFRIVKYNPNKHIIILTNIFLDHLEVATTRQK